MRKTSFKPGQSGNPKGRPPGRPDRRSQLRALIDAEAPALVARAVELALAGDVQALGLLLGRCISPLRPTSEPAPFPLPDGGLGDQARAVLGAMARGELDPHTGRSILDGLAAAARVIETTELIDRIERLENGGLDHAT